MNGIMHFTDILNQLINAWCARRAIRPLQCLLRAYPGPLAYPDQKHLLLEALRVFKSVCKDDLTEPEFEQVNDVVLFLDTTLRGVEP
jgi:hypothetical protein